MRMNIQKEHCPRSLKNHSEIFRAAFEAKYQIILLHAK